MPPADDVLRLTALVSDIYTLPVVDADIAPASVTIGAVDVPMSPVLDVSVTSALVSVPAVLVMVPEPLAFKVMPVGALRLLLI